MKKIAPNCQRNSSFINYIRSVSPNFIFVPLSWVKNVINIKNYINHVKLPRLTALGQIKIDKKQLENVWFWEIKFNKIWLIFEIFKKFLDQNCTFYFFLETNILIFWYLWHFQTFTNRSLKFSILSVFNFFWNIYFVQNYIFLEELD